jgi:hypothetical protein
MSKDRRRSIFGLGAFTKKDDSSNLLRKRRTASFMSTLSDISQHLPEIEYPPPADAPAPSTSAPAPAPAPAAAPASTLRPRPAPARQNKRASSVFGLRTSRYLDDEPLSTTSTRSSIGLDFLDDSYSRAVLQHGEVQTSGSMFRKKKEYLVLTETHLIRFKSYTKAADAFAITAPYGVASNTSNPTTRPAYRHSQAFSTASHDVQSLASASLASDASGDRDMGTPLRHIVAVYHLDDGRPYFALDIYYLDDETNQASSMTLQFSESEEMLMWLVKIREAANCARLVDANPLSSYNSHLAARVVEAERDYVPPHYAIYKVVLREPGKTASRASADDLSKLSASVCFLAIGVHKVHLIPLFKPPSQRSSSPSLSSLASQSSHGILNMTEVYLSEIDDTFQLTFR